MKSLHDNSDPSRDAGAFQTTCWSIVLAAAREGNPESSANALESLCRTYWYPLYAYVRRRVGSPEQAQDLTQEFFARVLGNHTIANADPERGRFRAFLLTACQRFLINEWRKGQTIRRGGGTRTLSLDFVKAEERFSFEPSDLATAEHLFEREWAVEMLNSVLASLKLEYAERGKQVLFDLLKPALTGELGENYQSIAESLDMQPGAIKVAAHRMRSRFGDLFRAAIADTVESTEHADAEIRRLFQVLAGKPQKNM